MRNYPEKRQDYIPLSLLQVPHTQRPEELMAGAANCSHARRTETFRPLREHIKQRLKSDTSSNLQMCEQTTIINAVVKRMYLILIDVISDEIRVGSVVHKISPTETKSRFFVQCTAQPTLESEVGIHCDY